MDKKEELVKSIDALLEDLFAEESVEKSIDIAKDAETKADEAANKAPKAQKDEARGAGRPKQISDIPQTDMDGRRDSEYDDSISDEKKEDEPEEAKKQAKTMDQTKEGGRAKASKAPEMKPFKKSLEVSEEEYAEFEAFKKSKAEAEAKAAEEAELKKAEVAKKEQEDLIKSAVAAALEEHKKENAELRKSLSEQQELLKAVASQPMQPKSITSVQALEKSMDPAMEGEKEPESLTKSEMLDVIEGLIKSKRLPEDALYEYDMTGGIYSAEHRKIVEETINKL